MQIFNILSSGVSCVFLGFFPKTRIKNEIWRKTKNWFLWSHIQIFVLLKKKYLQKISEKQIRIYLLISKREDCFESSSFVLRLTSPSRLDRKPFLSVVKLRASWILKTIDSSVEAGIFRSLWRGREISWLLLRCGGCGFRTFGSCSFIGCSFRKRWQTVALDSK